MPASRFEPDAVFEPAPAGVRVRLATAATVLAVIAAVTLGTTMTLRHGRPLLWPHLIAPSVALVAISIGWHGARIRRYRVTSDQLRIERAFQTVRFPLAGLQSATFDPEAFSGARKIVGNSGLGAVAGRFRSKRLGKFRAYLTDREHAVVLRWPDRCVVISPERHAWFVEVVRRRIDGSG